MKILVTAFDPFGGQNINPSLEVLKLLPNIIENVEIVKLEIPTVFRKSTNIIENAIKIYKPKAIISLGQAKGRIGITPERIAINLDDATIKDNEGNQPIDEIIYDDGNTAYFSTLPIKLMITEMNNNGITASISNSAGTFVCNHVMYSTLYLIDTKYNNILSGFIHIPCIPEQFNVEHHIPVMELKDIIRGIELCLKIIIAQLKKL